MKYFTTTEAAEIWGISSRRVALLASQGRIEGAISAGKNWLIPQDAPKPRDSRKKGAKIAPPKSKRYIFPFLLACVHSEEQVAQFTSEEADLYRLCLLFETGDFVRTRQFAEALLSAKNHYVRLGALYHLPTTCMYLFDFEAAQRYYILFESEVHSAEAHRAELQLLSDELDAELVSASGFAKKTASLDLDAFSDDVLPTVTAWKFFAELTMLASGKGTVDISNYEILCRVINRQGYFFQGMGMHLYLSSYYAMVNDYERERQHLKEAVSIGLSHGTVFTLAYCVFCNPDTAQFVLSEYPPDVAQRFADMYALFIRARSAYADYQGKIPLLSQLADSDYQLISYCLKEYSAEKMAKIFGLTPSGINRRLSKLYRKFGVKSKKELAHIALRSIMDWGKE